MAVPKDIARTWRASGVLAPGELESIEAHMAETGDGWRDAVSTVVPSDRRAVVTEVGATAEARLLARPGDEAPGRYTEARILGEGGMGRVTAADDAWLGRRVALKVCKATDAATTERFLREARIMGQLEHPGIVPVYELGFRSEGTPYYTMRRVRGTTLREAVRAQAPGERSALLGSLVHACQAVAYAHARGVIHRDLKPDNIMIGPFGETLVLDWGLARAESEFAPDTGDSVALTPGDGIETRAGAILGTILYMSPEQARGELVGPAADVWALGMIAWEVVAGRHPLANLAPSVALGTLRDGVLPPFPSEAAPEVRAILGRALHADPSARYPDAGALAGDLEAWRTGGRVGAHAYSSRELARRWLGRYRVAVTVAAVAFGAILVLGAVSVVRVVGERDRAIAAEARTAEALRTALVGGLRAAGERERAAGGPAAALAQFAAALAVDPDDDPRRRAEVQALLTLPLGRQAQTQAGPITSLGGIEGTLAVIGSSDGTSTLDAATGIGARLEATEGRRAIASVRHGDRVIGLYEPPGGPPEVLVHNAERGRLLQRRSLPEEPHTSTMALDPDGDVVVYKDAEARLRRFDVVTGAVGPPMEGDEAAYRQRLTFGPGSGTVTIGGRVQGTDTGYVRTRDVATGALVAEVRTDEPTRDVLVAGRTRLVALRSRVVALGADGAVVWQARGGAERLAASRDGGSIAAWDGESGLRVWRDGRLSAEAPEARGIFAVSPDGAWSAAAVGPGAIQLFDLTGDRAPRLLEAERAPLAALAFVGDALIAGGSDGTVRVWPLTAEGERLVDPGIVSVRAFSPSARHDSLALTHWAADRIGMWTPGGEVSVSTLDPARWVCDAGWTPGGDAFLLVATDRCWFEHEVYQNPSAPTIIWELVRGTASRLGEIPDPLRQGFVALSPDRQRLALGRSDGCAGVWSVRGERLGPLLCLPDDPIGALAWTPDGTRLVTVPDDERGDLAVWDPATSIPAVTFPLAGYVDSISVSPDGTRVALAGLGESLWLATADGSAVATVALTARVSTPPVWNADGTALAVGLETGRIVIVDGAREVRFAPILTSPAVSLAWSPDGTRIAAGGRAGDFAILDAPTLAVLRRGATGGPTPFALAWSRDAAQLRVGTRDGPIRMVPSGPLLDRTALLAAAVAAVNVRACSDQIGTSVHTSPWDRILTAEPVPCEGAAASPSPRVR